MKGSVPEKYQRCVCCPTLDAGLCGGPNFSTWENKAVVAFIATRAKHLNRSHKALAERGNLAPGTVDGILSGANPNPKMDTLRSLLLAVDVVDAGVEPCPNPEVINALQAEAADLRRKLEKANSKLQKTAAELEKAEENAQKKLDHLKGEISFLRDILSQKERLIKHLIVAIIAFFALWFVVELIFPDAGFIRY